MRKIWVYLPSLDFVIVTMCVFLCLNPNLRLNLHVKTNHRISGAAKFELFTVRCILYKEHGYSEDPWVKH